MKWLLAFRSLLQKTWARTGGNGLRGKRRKHKRTDCSRRQVLLSGKNIVGCEDKLATEYLCWCLMFANEAREKEGFGEEERLQGSKMLELSQTPSGRWLLPLALGPPQRREAESCGSAGCPKLELLYAPCCTTCAVLVWARTGSYVSMHTVARHGLCASTSTAPLYIRY